MSTYREALNSLKPQLKATHNAPYQYHFSTERWRSGGGGTRLTITVTVPHWDCPVNRNLLALTAMAHFERMDAVPWNWDEASCWINIIVRDADGQRVCGLSTPRGYK